MKINTVNSIYFSPTGTTKKIIETISCAIGGNLIHDIINITNDKFPDKFSTDGALTIVGVPVFSGRVPEIVISRLAKLNSNNGLAVAVCVYGNRAYDDALLELNNILVEKGFTVIASAAFIGQHSIFPKVGINRPNKDDLEIAHEFGQNIDKFLSNDIELVNAIIPGNKDYRLVKKIPLYPHINLSKCNKCNKCVHNCPVNAIEHSKYKINKTLCISCGRCIAICPQRARRFSGLLYSIVNRKFIKNFAIPLSPELFYNFNNKI